jgi:hypothetical protein
MPGRKARSNFKRSSGTEQSCPAKSAYDQPFQGRVRRRRAAPVIGLGQQCGDPLGIKRLNWATAAACCWEDQRTAKANRRYHQPSPPKDVKRSASGGVWVADPKVALPVAMSLRQSLIEVATARQASEGQQTKMEMVYGYLTGPRFRQRVQAIVEAFSSMKKDLDAEKKAITRQWAKRDEQIDRVMQATVGMYGDLQGIAGKTLQEIEGLEFQGMLDFKPEE